MVHEWRLRLRLAHLRTERECEMAEVITLQEIAKRVGVPRSRVKEYFERGRYLEYVPRPLDPNAKWVIYRKDFETAIARKEKQIESQVPAWDTMFELDAVALD